MEVLRHLVHVRVAGECVVDRVENFVMWDKAVFRQLPVILDMSEGACSCIAFSMTPLAWSLSLPMRSSGILPGVQNMFN